MGVESGVRFIEKYQRRLMQHHTGDPEPLVKTSGKRSNRIRCAAPQADTVDQ